MMGAEVKEEVHVLCLSLLPAIMQSEQPYTILRIKRKRNEEPLDALVVEDTARRKKSRPGGVFKFAQTVENEAWKDQKIQQQIQVGSPWYQRFPVLILAG